MILTVVLICIFLMIRHVEHLITYLLAIFGMSSLKKLFRTSAHVKIRFLFQFSTVTRLCPTP